MLVSLTVTKKTSWRLSHLDIVRQNEKDNKKQNKKKFSCKKND